MPAGLHRQALSGFKVGMGDFRDSASLEALGV